MTVVFQNHIPMEYQQEPLFQWFIPNLTIYKNSIDKVPLHSKIVFQMEYAWRSSVIYVTSGHFPIPKVV